MNFSGLQNDYVVRLLPKGVKYEELNVHEKVRSSSKRLKGNLLHYTYKNAMHWEQKFRTYAKRQALDYEKKVGRIGPYYLNVKPSWRFFRHYIIKAVFLTAPEVLNMPCGCIELLNGVTSSK